MPVAAVETNDDLFIMTSRLLAIAWRKRARYRLQTAYLPAISMISPHREPLPDLSLMCNDGNIERKAEHRAENFYGAGARLKLSTAIGRDFPALNH